MKQVLRLIGLVGVWAVIIFLGLRWIIQPDAQPLPCQLMGFTDSSETVHITDLLHTPTKYPFAPIKSPLFIERHTPFWIRILVANPYTHSFPVFIEAGYPSLNAVNAYVSKGNQLIEAFPHESWRTPFANRAVEHRMFIFPITLQPGQSYTVYLRLQRQIGNLRFPVRVWSASTFWKYDTSQQLLWGFVVGWLLVAVCFSLFLYSIHNDRLYLDYCASVFCSIMVLMVCAGYMREYTIESYLPDFGQFLRGATLLLAAISNMSFVRSLIWSKQYSPKWLYNTSNWLFPLISVPFILFLFESSLLNRLDNRAMTYLMNVISLTLPLIAGYSLAFILYGLRHPVSRSSAALYLLAFLPLFLAVNEFVLSLFHITLKFTDLLLAYALAVVFETTILLFGLAYRFKLYRDERETALREQRNIAMQTLYVERTRLARELHDYIGPDLAVLKMQIERDQEQHSSLSEQQLGLYIGSLNRILTDVRHVSHALLPIGLQETNLVTGLTQFIDTLSAVSGNPEISFVHNLHTVLPPFMQQSIYQITKELVLNAVKHAQASLVDVELYDQDNTLYLTVADDGRGYNPDDLSLSEGIGLRNLQAIIELLNGHLTINPKKKQGMVHQIALAIN